MPQAEHLERLRQQGLRCRELAQSASDDEAAEALHETADSIEAVLEAFDDDRSADDGIEGCG